MNCPHCGVELDVHEAGACLDRWLGGFMGFVAVNAATATVLDYPHYSTSLDAMAQVEAEIERRELVGQYQDALWVTMIPDNIWEWRYYHFRHATALQCCRAAIAVLGKEIK